MHGGAVGVMAFVFCRKGYDEPAVLIERPGVDDDGQRTRGKDVT